MTNHPNRSKGDWRVITENTQAVYSRHRTETAAVRAAKALAKKWEWSHPGTEPVVQHLTPTGWTGIDSFTTG